MAETDTQTANTAEALRSSSTSSRGCSASASTTASSRRAGLLVGHFPLTIETPDAIATQVLNQLFYELPVEELPRYRERV